MTSLCACTNPFRVHDPTPLYPGDDGLTGMEEDANMTTSSADGGSSGCENTEESSVSTRLSLLERLKAPRLLDLGRKRQCMSISRPQGKNSP